MPRHHELQDSKQKAMMGGDKVGKQAAKSKQPSHAHLNPILRPTMMRTTVYGGEDFPCMGKVEGNDNTRNNACEKHWEHVQSCCMVHDEMAKDLCQMRNGHGVVRGLLNTDEGLARAVARHRLIVSRLSTVIGKERFRTLTSLKSGGAVHVLVHLANVHLLGLWNPGARALARHGTAGSSDIGCTTDLPDIGLCEAIFVKAMGVHRFKCTVNV